ncbi:hypothetical protein B0E43_18795 [Algoriphagus sp. A40]|nr:hypothetical protein B0E43_18795 [Algoriphagus sp. A40]
MMMEKNSEACGQRFVKIKMSINNLIHVEYHKFFVTLELRQDFGSRPLVFFRLTHYAFSSQTLSLNNLKLH